MRIISAPRRAILREQILNCLETANIENGLKERILQRISLGKFTRDEHPTSHFCVYFFPYNPLTGRVFVGHHKKSGLWLPPGGHIDVGESVLDALHRETWEELHIDQEFDEEDAFLVTETLIDRPSYACKMHYDLWFKFVVLDVKKIDYSRDEFLDVQWIYPGDLAIGQDSFGRRIFTDQNTKMAAKLMHSFLVSSE